MGLFGDKKKELPPLFSEAELEPQGVDYNSVLDYLQGLSDADYATVCKVADIYRKANKEAADALGIENEPTTFIHPPEPEENIQAVHMDHNKPKSFLDDDDDISAAFLEDDHDTPASRKQRNIAKNAVDSVAKKPGKRVEVKD